MSETVATGVRAAVRAEAAATLLAAASSCTPIAPLSRTYPGLDVVDAYRIQELQVAEWGAQGREVSGYKVGLTSLAMQTQLGVDQPDYGMLTGDMEFVSGAGVPRSAYIVPKVEPEIAVVLAEALQGPGLTMDDVARAVGSVVGTIEIIDSRIADWKITLVDTIADNASSAGVVVGATSVTLSEIDVVETACTLRINGTVVGEGTGAAVMGSPLEAIAWLANTLGSLGVRLEPGRIVLPGSVCAAVAVAPGDHVEADFGPILGTVSVTFTEEVRA